jgi:tight adherence protein B
MSLITIFVILLIAAFGTVTYLTEPSEGDKQIRERLVGIASRAGKQEYEEEIVRQVTFSRIPSLDRFLRNSAIANKLQLILEQAKVPLTVGRLVFLSALLIVVGATIGNWWIPVGFVGWMVGVMGGGIPFVWVLYKRSQRCRRFESLLPDAIDLISRALRAGHALPSALLTVAEEMADPVGPEFRLTADELNYGLPFREALLNLEQRIPLPDLHYLVTAVVVQKEGGGNLVEVLDKSASTLRSRVLFHKKVRTFTAQGRITGVILVALPFICFALLNIVQPGYSRPLFENDFGRKLIYVMLVSMAIGIFLIRRIVKVKV